MKLGTRTVGTLEDGRPGLSAMLKRDLSRLGAFREDCTQDLAARLVFGADADLSEHQEFTEGFWLAIFMCGLSLSPWTVKQRTTAAREELDVTRDALGVGGSSTVSTVVIDLEAAKRKRLGGGIDWTTEPASQIERDLRAKVLGDMASCEIALMMYAYGSKYTDEARWPRDVTREYALAEKLEDREKSSEESAEMRARIEEARCLKSSKAVAFLSRDPEPVA